LNAAERNYSAIEREALAIVYGIRGTVTIYRTTNSKTLVTIGPLQWLEAHKVEENRLGRWAIELAAAKYKIPYKPGKGHANVDFLSRIRVVNAKIRKDFTDNIIEEQRKDETCSKIRCYLEEGILSEQDELDNPDWVKKLNFSTLNKGW